MQTLEHPDVETSADTPRTDFRSQSVQRMLKEIKTDLLGNWERLLSPRHWNVDMANDT